MKNKIMMAAFLMALLGPGLSQARDFENLESGSPELNSIVYKDMTPAGIQKVIREEIKELCGADGLCKLYGVQTETDTHWELSFSAGQGTQGSGQKVYYIGGTQNVNGDNRYVGATLTIKGPVTCRTSVMVDPSVLRLIKSYMYNNVKDDGKVARDFTEAEKTVMMFYGKIIEKAATCQTGK